MGIDNFDEIAGGSQAMRSVYFLVEQVASSKTTVLIRGETGVGKERIAEHIWQAGPRNARPFVRVNCAALSENLIESELFGHEKGAFTGALALRRGRFELAHTGTLFLDEIGEISPSTQAKLLRVLQTGTFERVGGTETHKVDVRIIAATNRDLEAMIEDGRFRLDLYYRLNVFPIYVPPLRERPCDLLQLANTFLEKFAWQNHKRITRISTSAINMLTAYHWPGNVRELENVIERAVLLSTDDAIHGSHLPPTLQLPVLPKINALTNRHSLGCHNGCPLTKAAAEAEEEAAGTGEGAGAGAGSKFKVQSSKFANEESTATTPAGSASTLNIEPETSNRPPATRSLPDAIRQLKLDMITDALKAARGVKSTARLVLGLSEKVFDRYLAELNIDFRSFHRPAS